MLGFKEICHEYVGMWFKVEWKCYYPIAEWGQKSTGHHQIVVSHKLPKVNGHILI